MAVFGGMTLTNKGLVLQGKAQAGAHLKYTRMAIGDGSLTGQSIPAMNGLLSQKISLPITRLRTQPPNKAIVGAVLRNADVATGFYWREVGLFAQDPDAGEILYAYANAGVTADYIPPGGGSDIIEKSFDCVVVVGTASNISAVIDESLVYALRSDLDAVAAAKVDKVTGKQLSTEDYTTPEKTKLAGVAPGANNYTHPPSHPASMITEDTTHRFSTDAEKVAWSAKETTAGAQAKADAAKDAAITAAAADATAKANAARDAAIAAAVAADAEKLNANAYTAADVLAKIITVDGSGSGLDADTVRGFTTNQNLSTTNTPRFDGVDFRRSDNYRVGADKPSSYPLGETIFFNLDGGGWPAEFGTVVSYRTYGGAMSVFQYFYPYNVVAPIKYRYSLYTDDTWSAWETILTGKDAKGFAVSNPYVNFGDTDAPMNTDEFIALLTAMGAFTASGHWVARGGWAYDYNRTITDSGFGHISLAGAVVEVTGNSTFFTVRILTAPQAATPEAGLNANSEFIYASNGPGYVNGWRKQINNKNALAGTVGSTTFVTDANTIPKDGYYAVASLWTGSPFPGTQGPNQGYLEQFTWGDSPAYKVQRFMPINAYDPSTRGQRYRILNNGVWEPWARQWDSSNDVPLYAARRTISGGANLNDYVGNGAYSLYVEGGAYLNGPPPGYYLLDVKVAESGYVIQDALNVFGSARYSRARTDSGVWSGWQEVAIKDWTGKIANVAANRARGYGVQLTTTTGLSIASYTASATSMHTVKICMTVTNQRSVAINVYYTGIGGEKQRVVLPLTSMAPDDYDFIPVTIYCNIGTYINVVAQTTLANSVYVTAVITEEG